jgi:hypothetical protein
MYGKASRVVSFEVDEAMLDEIRRTCYAQGVGLDQLVTSLLNDYVNEQATLQDWSDCQAA